MADSDGGVFVRDRATYLSYAVLGVFTFDLYAFGPALALLRSELHLSYAVIGIHSAVWAGGSAVAGLTFAPMVRRIGRRRALWWSSWATATGSVVFALAHVVAVSLAGAAIMGTAGTFLLIATSAVLSDRHGPGREQALVEANIGAGVLAVVAPLLLGAAQAISLSWRVAFALPILGYGLLYLVYRHEPLPTPAATPGGGGGGRLPWRCWVLALLVALSVAIEFCVIYFGAELLERTVHLGTDAAASALSLFYIGILAGRVAGGWLTRRAGRGAILVLDSLAVTLVGFLAFWLSSSAPIALSGLFVTGVGVANIYPLGLALALAAAPDHADVANARAQVVAGLVVLASPLLLGAFADHVGLRTAFIAEPALLAVSALLLALGRERYG